MSYIKQYSIWVMPNKDSKEYKLFRNKIRELREKFKSKYNLPDFEPHVSLLVNIKDDQEGIISKTTELAKLIKPFWISFGEFDYNDEYYQCLVIRAIVNNEIIQANKKARDVFERHKDSLYVPHLSLMYEEKVPQRTKKELISQMSNQFKEVKFYAESLHIFTSGIPVPKWTKVAEIPLSQ